MAVILLSCNSAMQSTSNALTSVKGTPMLLGKVSMSQLDEAPFKEWYQREYTAYVPNATIKDSLAPKMKGYSFELFFGTWCGDSRREVPRIMKLMDQLRVKPSAIALIGVGNRDTLYKQSPAHEESGKHIYRVPTLAIYKNGKEVGRITETPVNTWEKDMLDILMGRQYVPKFPVR
jgi:thiol-disulfide isomerase/thioredoxin